MCEEHVFEWKKGKRYKAERVRYGGTDFDAPTKWVNERNFDGHIVLTDMMAPKPVTSKCKRLWVTTAQYADRPYFETKELVLVVDWLLPRVIKINKENTWQGLLSSSIVIAY